MAREFRLPDIGEGLAEAEIIAWLVSVGDEVAADQNVVEVETDKAVVEIPIPYAGTVLHLGAAEGEVVEVGSVLIVVGAAGEVYPPAGADAAPIVGSISEEAQVLDERVAPEVRTSLGATVKALPVVRKLARDLGIELEDITGSGPEGRITREDVMAAARPPEGQAAGHPSAEAAPPPAPEVTLPGDTARPDDEPAPEPVPEPAVAAEEMVTPPEPRPGDERVRMSRMRRTIAANMSRAWSEIPHVTTFDEVDARRLLDARRALIARHGRQVSIDALVVKAVIPALRAFPDFNATLDGDDIVHHGALDIGVAVDTDDGLMVVVVRAADALGLIDLSARIAELAELGKRRALGLDQLTGQTFTVSNIGAVGGGLGTPIVPPGTTAILSVGRAVDRPVAVDGAVKVSPMMPLSLSYDHRVIDGAQGRRFMGLVLENLSEPALFLA
jgi:pyruvate dehydrogenase E2 component (dihydrolipoamide acetyltransferase)